MIETLGTLAEITVDEIENSVGKSSLNFDSSKAMDFSNDFEKYDSAIEEGSNGEIVGQIRENNSITDQNKLDTSKSLDFSKTDETFNIDKESYLDTNKKQEYSDVEKLEKHGGSYGELRSEGHGWNHNPPEEVHHMPSAEASPLDRNDGPAIAMDYEDHRQTASCGNSREAQEYRAKQAELIKEGKFREAMQMDIDDIHDKFGDKYDNAIAEMMEYAENKGII